MTDEQITRPNGIHYRRRSGVRAETYWNGEEMTCVVVIGTHDLARAAELARRLWEYDDDLPEGTRRWLRLVPWDTGHGMGDSSWVEDPVRGRPVVTFEPDPW